MEIDRRNFLKIGASLGMTLAPGCATIRTETSSATSEILMRQILSPKDREKTYSLIQKREFGYFIEIYGIKNNSDYKNILGEIQRSHGLTNDYIIGPNTLRTLYDSVYPTRDNLPIEVAERIEISQELQDLYSKKEHRGLGHTSSSRFYSQEDYYHNRENLEYLENGLEKYIDHPDSLGKYIESDNLRRENSIIVREIGGMLRFLYFDGEGKLAFASSTATGNGNNGGVKTPKWQGISLTGVIEIDKTSRQFNQAVMPYAVHITDGIWVHGGAVSGNDVSKGCIRLPYNAAKHFWEIATNNDLKDMKIFVEDNEI